MTHHYERGQRFDDVQDPSVKGLMVLEAGNIGYDGYVLAEEDTSGTWRSYWIKDRHLHDMVYLNVLTETEAATESMVQRVEGDCRAPERRAPSRPEGVVPTAD